MGDFGHPPFGFGFLCACAIASFQLTRSARTVSGLGPGLFVGDLRIGGIEQVELIAIACDVVWGTDLEATDFAPLAMARSVHQNSLAFSRFAVPRCTASAPPVLLQPLVT